MEKQVNTKGFTLVEMMIVLSFVSTFLLIVPYGKSFDKVKEKYQFSYLKERLLLEQQNALFKKEEIEVEIHNDSILVSDEEVYRFTSGFTCDDSEVVFHENGNVNQALTIHCYGQKNYSLVISLGSGRMYEK